VLHTGSGSAFSQSCTQATAALVFFWTTIVHIGHLVFLPGRSHAVNLNIQPPTVAQSCVQHRHSLFDDSATLGSAFLQEQPSAAADTYHDHMHQGQDKSENGLKRHQNAHPEGE
jgi:hypothetical protein